MRLFSVIVFLGFGLQLSAQQDCKTTLFLDATLDSIVYKTDTVTRAKKDTAANKTGLSGIVDYAAVRTKSYGLKPPAPAYIIVSFKVITEEGEYINEVLCQGNSISPNAERIIWQRKPGTPVYFTCIMVKHPNGKIYTLKDLTVNIP
jgi:hypothetical protein